MNGTRDEAFEKFWADYNKHHAIAEPRSYQKECARKAWRESYAAGERAGLERAAQLAKENNWHPEVAAVEKAIRALAAKGARDE